MVFTDGIPPDDNIANEQRGDRSGNELFESVASTPVRTWIVDQLDLWMVLVGGIEGLAMPSTRLCGPLAGFKNSITTTCR